MKNLIDQTMTGQKKGGVLRVVLRACSYVYGCAARLRIALYQWGLLRKNRLDKPVISVGNITVGGVGKTPLVLMIAKYLKKNDLNPVILTRGYMDKKQGCHTHKSDEVQMIRESLEGVPVLVGANRFRNAKGYLRNNKADVFLLDDGFQHVQLKRDLDIVAIDTVNPWGNGHLLPRGILREPVMALSRADLIVLTRTDLGASRLKSIKEHLNFLPEKKTIIETIHKPTALISLRSAEIKELLYLNDKTICDVSGIGNARAFQETLTNLNAHLKKSFDFMDHHPYSKTDVSAIVEHCRKARIKTIVTTHKDAVKLNRFLYLLDEDMDLLYLKINIDITHGEGALFERINDII